MRCSTTDTIEQQCEQDVMTTVTDILFLFDAIGVEL